MNGRGGWDDDMPNLPSPPGSVPPAGDAAYEALLGGSLLPADADERLRPLAEAIATLAVTPAAGELAGEQAARAAYRSGFSPDPWPARAGQGPGRTRGARPRNRVLAAVLSTRLAAAAVLTAGALAAGAYTGVLPAPVQSFAHHAFGAPAPHPAATPAPPQTPAGPARHSPARHSPAPARPAPGRPGAQGLCHAYTQGHGRAAQKAAVFRKLAAAAGGTGQVIAYCAGMVPPAKTPPGQQASHAAGHQASHGAGHPSAASSHPPPAHPTHEPPGHRGHTPGTHPSHPGHHPASRPAGHPGRLAGGHADQ